MKFAILFSFLMMGCFITYAQAPTDFNPYRTPNYIAPNLSDTIPLREDSLSSQNDLAEFIVSATLPYMKLKGSDLIIDVGKSPLGDLPMAEDIIKQLPFVRESESGFSILGRGKAIIYIGNRKINEMSEITRLQPSAIKSIEIIRYPGAEYDASTSAVIKIILKKNTFDGLGLNVRTQLNMGRRMSDYQQFSLNYGINNLTLFLNGSNSSFRANSDQNNIQCIFAPDGLWKMISNMPNWKSEYYDWIFSGGLSLTLCAKHSFGTKLTYTHDNTRNNGEKNSNMYRDGEPFEFLTTWSSERQKYKLCQINIFYDGALSEKLNLIFNCDYANRKSKFYHGNDEIGNLTPRHEVTNSGQNNYNLVLGILKSEWKINEKSVFSFGIDGSILSQKRTSIQNEPQDESTLDSRESKLAFFGQYDLSFSNFNFNIGLRYETNRMRYEDMENMLSILDKSYGRLYPDATISTTFGKTTMALGFSSKIRRPSFYQLRNSREYFNRFETTSGNPLLMPTYSYELSYSLQYDNLTTNLGFRKINNFITERSEIINQNPINILSLPVNSPDYSALSLNVSYNKKFGLWTGYLSAYITKTFYKLEADYNIPSKMKQNPYFDLSLSNYFNFWGTTAFITLNYNPSGADCDSWESSYMDLNAGIYRRFLNKSLYISLQGTNIMGAKRTSTIYTNITSFQRKTFKDNQKVILTISYSFKNNQKYKGKTSAQEEINRM